MKVLSFILLISISLVTCNNADVMENGENQTPVPANKPDTILADLTKSNDSNKTTFDTSAESNINYKDLERIHHTWSGSRTDKFISKKGFKFFSDTFSSETKIVVFRKSEPGEILEITNSNYSDGELSFSINYYTTSKVAYDNFIESVKSGKYKYNKRTKRYEIFMGTYEDLCIYTNGQVLKNNELYYWVKYLHIQGKELSTPIMDEHLTKDTIK